MVGFDAKNKNDINKLYLCRLCSLILREPVQLVCGHRQCKTCIDSNEGETIKCVECQEEMLKNQTMLDRGFRRDMTLLSIICSLCEWNGVFKNYEEHLNQAHPNPICEFCGEKCSTIRLDEHKQKECTKNILRWAPTNQSCLVSTYCIGTPHDRSDIFRQSTVSNSTDHSVYETSSIQNERSPELEISIGQTVPTSTVLPPNQNISPEMQEICEVINIFARALQTLSEDRQRLHDNTNQLRNLLESVALDCSALESMHHEQDALMNGIQLNQEILRQEVASLKQKINDMQYASYDGTCIWKIINVRENMMRAQSGRQRSIYSPPFYSSKSGYKMCANLFLNGDGNDQQTHMSLFFILMPGQYDAILTFPFGFKVIFCLYDQTSQQRHVIRSFRPDTKSKSSQRPQLTINILGGIPDFFPLEIIRQEGNPYVRDDTMLIKVMVDFIDMPEPLLRYALSLDPGIPIDIQQMMIEQEAERQANQRGS